MTLARIGANELLRTFSDEVRGSVLQIGSGTESYEGLFPGATTLDISATGAPDVVADAHRLPIRSHSFDGVVASQLLEHVLQPAVVIAEAARVLRPGGTFLCAVPFLYWIHSDPHDYYRFTGEGLTHLLAEQFDGEIVVRGYGSKFAVAADVLASVTAESTIFRIGPRWIRLRLLGAPKRDLRIKWLARWLMRHTDPIYPLGYVAYARRLQ